MTGKDYGDFIDAALDRYPEMAEFFAVGKDEKHRIWRAALNDCNIVDLEIALTNIHRGNVKIRGEVYRPYRWSEFPAIVRTEAKSIAEKKAAAFRSEAQVSELRAAASRGTHKPLFDDEMALAVLFVEQQLAEQGISRKTHAARECKDAAAQSLASIWEKGAAGPRFPSDWQRPAINKRKLLHKMRS